MMPSATTNQDLMLRAAGDIEAFVIAGAAELAANIVDANNAGGGQATPAPIDTGQLRGGVRVTINEPSSEEGEARPSHARSYPLTSGKDVRKAIQLGGMQVGDTIWERWIAPYANIIEGGRTTDKNGREIGSLDAAEGWVWTCIDEAISRLDRWRYEP